MSAFDLDTVVRALAREGWVSVETFLDEETVRDLANEAEAREREGGFRPARIGKGTERALRPEVRGDLVDWLDEHGSGPATRRYLEILEALRLEINRNLFLGLFEFEGHFAIYPPGTSYEKHLDRFKTSSARVVSCLLYLNLDWAEDDGGELRLYLDPAGDREFVDIPPRAGTFVAFFSDRFHHEVRPARRRRLSLTGWFRRRAPSA